MKMGAKIKVFIILFSIYIYIYIYINVLRLYIFTIIILQVWCLGKPVHNQCWGELLLKVMHYNIALLPKKVTSYVT